MTRKPNPAAPRIAILGHASDGLVNDESEPMTTDIAIELFDFGEMTEEQLDEVAAEVAPGETRNVRCATEDSGPWTITIRRID